MAGETPITLVGNVVEDPELRFTPAGAAVCKFRMASTPRILDKQSGEWRDGDALFLPVSIWKQYAENVAESVKKGMRVVVTGALRMRTYDDKEGNKRTVYEVQADEISISLRYATATVTRNPKGGGGASRSAAVGDDPWESSRPATVGGGGSFDDEPPF